MNSFTVRSYWKSYEELPAYIRQLADTKFELWKENPFHPSLHFKCVNSEDNIWSVRINTEYRALAVREGASVIWYWVGDHKKYEQLLKA
jgi:hypothetical protein